MQRFRGRQRCLCGCGEQPIYLVALIGAPYAAGDIEIALTGRAIVSQPYIELTMDVMARFGAGSNYKRKKPLSMLEGGRRYSGRRLHHLRRCIHACLISSWLPLYAAGRVKVVNIQPGKPSGRHQYPGHNGKSRLFRSPWRISGVEVAGGRTWRDVLIDMGNMP